MRKFFVICAILVLAACGEQGNYASKEEFIESFTQAILNDDPGKLDSFFITSSDFSPEASNRPGDEQLQQARDKFLTSAQRLATDLRERKVIIDKIQFGQNKPDFSANIQQVTESYRDVQVILRVDDQRWVINIAEVLKTGENWRMTGFYTTVDLGTDSMDMIEIEIPAEEEKKITEEK